MMQFPFLYIILRLLHMAGRRVSVCVVFMAIMPLALCAQQAGNKRPTGVYKKSTVVKTYRAYVKQKDYAKAKQEIDKAMDAHAEAASDTKMYTYKVNALNELIKQENRKIYLNQRPDTVTYFNYIYQMYETALKADSIEQARTAQLRAEGKKAKVKLRSEMGNALVGYRNNVANAGKYFYNKKDYKNAFKYLDLYLSTKNAGVFNSDEGGISIKDPDDAVALSTLAVLSAYASSNYSGVMRYIAESANDNMVKSQILEIGYKSALAMNDSTSMLAFLQRGFELYPETEYFFMSLVRFYADCNEKYQALEIIDKMLKLYPDNRDYNYMRGKQLLLLDCDDEAIVSFEKCLELEADDAESYSSLGDIYLEKAQDAYMKFNLPLSDPGYAKRKKQIEALYSKACHNYESAKKYDENNVQLWLTGLRESYFKLNKGRELRSLDKYK